MQENTPYHTNRYSSPNQTPPGFIARTFGWLFLGLSLSSCVAYLFSPTAHPALFEQLFNGPFWLLILLQLRVVFFSRAHWRTLSFGSNSSLFFVYAALNGTLLTLLFHVYTDASVAHALFVMAITFGVLAVYSSIANYRFDSIAACMGTMVLGLCIAQIVTTLTHGQTGDFVISVLGVALFTLIIVWEAQKIRHLSTTSSSGQRSANELALQGALNLYLGLVDITLFLLRGDRKKRKRSRLH